MDYSKLASNVLQLVGGEPNIISLVHCATRLRFKLKNPQAVDKKAIEQLTGVIQVVESGGQFQVVIGNEVNDVYRAIIKITKLDESKEKPTVKSDSNPLNQAIDIIAGIFTPLLGAMAGTGLLKGVLTVALALKWLSTDSGTYQILMAAADSLFYFLPILLAYTAARKFDTDPFVAVTVAGTLLHPNLSALLQKGAPIDFLGIPVILTNYSSSVIPIILAVFAMSKVEPVLNKSIHPTIKRFLVPLSLVVIIVPITLLIFGPFGTYLGQWLALGYTAIYNGSPIIAGLFTGACWQLLVIFGLHWGLIPVAINNLSQYGSDTFSALLTPAVFAQAGAALGVWLKSKQLKVKEIAGPATISGIIGITEAAIYGVNLRYKKPFVTGSIAGAIGGAIAGFSGAASHSFGIPGLMTLPIFFGKGFEMFLVAVITAFSLGAILTYCFGYRDEGEVEAEPTAKPKPALNQGSVHSPLSGKVVPLKDIKDAAFASGALGQGIAIVPTDGTLYSPVNGTVTTVFPTGHAIGITADDGTEILLHMGLDTVQLNGQFFEVKVKQGAKVEAGQVLAKFDIAAIAQAGYDLATPVIITNSNNYRGVISTDSTEIKVGEPLLTLVS